MKYINNTVILKLIFMILIFPQIVVSDDGKVTPNKIISDKEIEKDAIQILSKIVSLGTSCGRLDQIPFVVEEVKRILQGVYLIVSEIGTQLVMKEDFPTVCHVLTQNQLNMYTENPRGKVERKCVTRDPITRRCLTSKTLTYPKPSYYWPKYFIEVTQKGNDSHPTFSRSNKLYEFNRSISKSISRLIDYGGAVKLTSFVMGGSNLLSTVGLKLGDQDSSMLMKNIALTPFENMRVRSNKETSLASYDANIWPIPLSYTLAKHFTVCGPLNSREGKHPGGSFESPLGVALTCPMAMSQDALAFWDTGMLDYLDPKAIATMAASSNPVSCGMDIAAHKLANLKSKKSLPLGDQTTAQGLISQYSRVISLGLSNCSYPILGTSAALAQKAMSMSDPDKWTDLNCTLWGSLAPRMSTAVYDNEYSYANAALKFKMLAHELFGIPRGSDERWSLAYPWEGPGSSLGSEGLLNVSKFLSKAFPTFKDGNNSLSLGKKDSGSSSRSEALMGPGDPKMINASTSMSYLAQVNANNARDMAAAEQFKLLPGSAILASEIARANLGHYKGINHLPGDKRIFTIWEKIECFSNSPIINYLGIKNYKSCHDAIRFEIYKYIQLKLVRKMCDLLKQNVGKPWK